MPPYNFPIEELVLTSEMKIARPKQETPASPDIPPQPAQPVKPAKRKYDPLNPFADWPEEMMFIVNRYPPIRFAILEALEKEIKLGNFV